jgi:hypothetical protein
MNYRKLLVVLTFVCMLGVTGANASMFTLTPSFSAGQTASSGDLVTFDLNLQVSDTFATNSWELLFGYDAKELALDSISCGLGFDEFQVNDSENSLQVFAGTFEADITLNAGSNPGIASFTFKVVAPPIEDGVADVELFAQFDSEGFWNGTDVFNPVAQFDGAQGADIAPVPVPAAVWLLGSGLIGLIWVRKKRV